MNKKITDIVIRDKSKPTILVVTAGLLPVPPVMGGAIQALVYEQAQLIKGHFNIVIVSSLEKGMKEYELDDKGIGHIHIRNKSFDNFELYWNFEYIFRYNRYIQKAAKIAKEILPSIVHIHNSPHYVSVMRKALGKSTKIILTNHNDRISGEQYILKNLKSIAAQVDQFIYPSRRVAEVDLVEPYPEYEEKTSVIYNFVDLHTFKKQKDTDIQEFRKKYDLVGKKVVLFVGRLNQQKAVDKILEAMPKVLESDPSVRLLIVGSSFFGKGKKTPYVKELLKLAEPIKDKVVFTGYIDHEKIPLVFSACDVFASPVNWEDPSPRVMYEAAACETAILSTNMGGIPEIVIDGESALLMDSPYEIEELSDTMISLLQDPETRDTLGKNGRARMQSNFTDKEISKKWVEKYNSLLTN